MLSLKINIFILFLPVILLFEIINLIKILFTVLVYKLNYSTSNINKLANNILILFANIY